MHYGCSYSLKNANGVSFPKELIRVNLKDAIQNKEIISSL